MPKANASIGGSIGGIIGLMVGIALPVQGVVSASLFSRITGNVAVSSDPTGFIIGGLYSIIGLLLGAGLGAIIGGSFE